MHVRFLVAFTAAMLLACVASCKTSLSQSRLQNDATSAQVALNTCVALRGNGHYISTHFGGLARILEDQGEIGAMAGGSSSTITMFLHESISLNPFISNSPPETRAAEKSLLLKSLLGYLEFFEETPEAQAITSMISIVEQAKKSGVFALPSDKWQDAAGKINTILSQNKYRALINPNILAMLRNQDSLGYASYQMKVQEVIAAIKTFGSFDASDERIFFREGLLNFDALATRVGMVGDFYAGIHQPSQNLLVDFVKQCTPVNRGRTWAELSSTLVGKSTCGERFYNAVRTYRAAMIANGAMQSSRVEELIGQRSPSIVVTSIIEGPAGATALDEARGRYLKGQTPGLQLNFNDVYFGYWIPELLNKNIASSIAARTDAKARKFLHLGSGTTWRKAISASPAEPGLSKAVYLSPTRISVGGWPDLHPVQILKSSGCKNVFYITRRGPETDFIISPTPLTATRPRKGIAELLGANEAERSELFDVTNPKGAFNDALKSATGVLCTDWNKFKDAETSQMMADAYKSQLVAPLEGLTASGDSSALPIVGCNPL